MTGSVRTGYGVFSSSPSSSSEMSPSELESSGSGLMPQYWSERNVSAGLRSVIVLMWMRCIRNTPGPRVQPSPPGGYSRNDAVSSHTCDGSCELDRDDASGVAMRHGNVPNIVVVRVVERDVVLLNRIVIAAITADALGRERSRAILAHEIVTHFDCLS